MTKEGYKGVSLKSEVADKFRAASAAEDMTLSSFLEEVLEKDKLTLAEIREVVKEAMTEVLEGFISGLKEEAKRSEYERLREKWQKIIGDENCTCVKDREE